MLKSLTTTRGFRPMDIKNRMRPVHPGEVLREELEEMDMSASALAKALDVPVNRVTGVLNGTRSLTANTALRLSRYLGTTAEFWMNLQKTYELRVAEKQVGKTIANRIKPRAA